MINLLPEDTKKQLRAAHYNVILLECIVFLGVGILFLGIACGVSYIYLKNSDTSGSDKSTYAVAKKQLDSIKNDISTTNNILSERISYSSVVIAIAAALPANTTINQLSITSNISNTTATFQVNGSASVTTESLKADFSPTKSPLFAGFNALSASSSNLSDNANVNAAINCTLNINKGISL